MDIRLTKNRFYPEAVVKGQSARRFRLIFILVIGLAFIYFYFQHPGRPGEENPLGWFDGFDQGEYLKSAKAFARWDLSASEHFYPPLYSFLGSLFITDALPDPFVFVNFACLLIFAYAFLVFSSRYVPAWLGAIIFITTVVFDVTLFENFVIPWSSTVAAALLSVGILGLVHRQAFITVSLFLGLLATLRPVDQAVGGAIWIGCLMMLLSQLRLEVRAVWPRIVAGLAALSAGSVLYLLFNFAVFGTPLGGYFKTVWAVGFVPADLPEKFVSLFIDGGALYLEDHSALIARYPWLLVALAACVYALIWGDIALRIVGAAIICQFLLYLPYTDLLPTGLWRFRNIHYFRWAFPYLLLLAVVFCLAVLRAYRTRNPERWVLAFVFLAVPVGVMSLKFETQWTTPINVSVDKDQLNHTLIRVLLPGGSLSMVDIDGVRADFVSAYFGSHALSIDGRALAHVKEYRLIPKNNGVRVLLIRPSSANSLAIHLDPRLKTRSEVGISVGDYRLSLGSPRLF